MGEFSLGILRHESRPSEDLFVWNLTVKVAMNSLKHKMLDKGCPNNKMGQKGCGDKELRSWFLGFLIKFRPGTSFENKAVGTKVSLGLGD